MRRLTMIVATVLGLVLAGTGSAQAITWGQPDKDQHPAVVMVVGLLFVHGKDSEGRETEEVYYSQCSGTLLESTLVLTAGHCTAEPGLPEETFEVEYYVSNDPAPLQGFEGDFDSTDIVDYLQTGEVDWVLGEPATHDRYGRSFPDTYDIGVVELSGDGIQLPGGVYPQLPDAGMLDQMMTRKGTPSQRQVTVVGYGLQATVPKLQEEPVRHQGTATIVGLGRSANQGSQNIQLSNNPGRGTGSGGTCLGDSGGPAFWIDPDPDAGEETITVVGITSFMMTGQCAGTNFSFRTDTAAVHDFVDEHRRT